MKKIKTIFLFMALFAMQMSALAQNITLNRSNVPLKEIMDEIEKKTDYKFLYRGNAIDTEQKVSIALENVSVEDALKALLAKTNIDFRINGKQIVLTPKTASPDVSLNRVEGRVTDKDGNPLPGATVLIKGTTKGTTTDANGNYVLKVPEGTVLVFTFIGYEKQEIPVSDHQEINVIMKEKTAELKQVVVTGMYTRKKESFTGAATTFTGEELKTLGNKNVLESLQTLDPSFVMVENNIQGSNPNQLPKFEIRGKTAITTANLNNQFSNDPNQPLFILDGFESTLQAIYDLDINRVASITILKDAVSTALYGSKAANGVIVVETKRPVAGELRVNYTADFSFDIPDLRSYNLMDAAEKLEFEKLSGAYSNKANRQWEFDEMYAQRLAEIQRGVNTYWLNEPVHTGITNKHSLQLSGGNQDLLFNAGISYGNQNGVMKGSGRETWGGNVNITYRKGKINISNMLSISGYKGDESPYGSFADFAQANPYYRKRNADGSISKYLDSVSVGVGLPPNPLYNASLFSIDQTKAFSFNNNIQAIWTFSNSLRLQGGIQIAKGNTTAVVFIPPENTQFEETDVHQRGNYTNTRTENRSYNANLMLTYAKVIHKHQINANVRADIGETHSEIVGFSAVGFPYGTNGNPIFANVYTPYGRPSASTSTSRSTGFMAGVNYVYDERFLFDAVYRLDGSTVFGSNQVFRPFASAGIGWNLHNESFLKNVKWIELLKIRGDIGVTGNENLGQFTSVSTYTSTADINNFGIGGLNLLSLGNPDLEWQNTRQISCGIDFTLWHNRLSGYLEYYNKRTDPLVIDASGTLPSSVGINENYVLNVGNLTTTGWSFNLRVSPIYNVKERIIWTIGIIGSTYESTYGDLGNKLDVYNEEELNSRGFKRYKDGYSPDDMWAVVSRGIDPASGREIFQKMDGTLTFDYEVEDIVKVGNTRPKMEGVINSSFTYKEFTLGVNVRYRIAGYLFNSALYEKVENVSKDGLIYNQDKRALYDRWQEPGDVSQFRAIDIMTSSPAMSSRFIQKDTHFVGESISLSWRKSDGWIKKLKMQSLSINLYLNDIFRIETVKNERGIEYPFSRSVSLSLNVSF